MTFPWEQTLVPVVTDAPALETTVAALQRDIAYIVTHTAVLVHSRHTALQMLFNVPRGQIVPRGECKFSDGSTLEFQDVGMPQVGAPESNVRELVLRAWNIAKELGLELEQ